MNVTILKIDKLTNRNLILMSHLHLAFFFSYVYFCLSVIKKGNLFIMHVCVFILFMI